MYAKEVKGDKFVLMTQQGNLYILALYKTSKSEWEKMLTFRCVEADVVKSKHTFMAEREAALADFVPICQKVGGRPLGEDAYDTSISFNLLGKESFVIVAETQIGDLKIKKTYPLSFARFAQEVFGVSDMWDPEAY